MKSYSYRKVNALAALLCAIYLCLAFILQNYFELLPCPLCILQRWVVGILGIFFLIGSIYANSIKFARIYGVIIFFLTWIGIYLSIRHIWLLYHPSKTMGVCIPSLSHLLKQYSLPEAAKTLFWGSGDCAKMAESFWGMSLPFWTLLGFLSLAIISFWQIVRKN